MANRSFSEYVALIFKGIGMGAANVIPGVSGGTIALITGIFEELIDSIKSFNLVAVKLLFQGKFKEFAAHTNLGFLVAIFFGVAISIISLSRLLKFLFAEYPVFVWAFFFGLILASIYFVGKSVSKWSASVIIFLTVGTAIAIGISYVNSAAQNEGFLYLMICGVVAICSMILPGLSGSFVLILMGNYELVVIDAITNVRIEILIPVLIGAGVGLVLFSHLLSWVFKSFRNQTIAFLTGFILGSLAVLWPWQTPIYKVDAVGNFVTKLNGDKIIVKYTNFIPESFSPEVIWAIVIALFGIVAIWGVEKYASAQQ